MARVDDPCNVLAWVEDLSLAAVALCLYLCRKAKSHSQRAFDRSRCDQGVMPAIYRRLDRTATDTIDELIRRGILEDTGGGRLRFVVPEGTVLHHALRNHENDYAIIARCHGLRRGSPAFYAGFLDFLRQRCKDQDDVQAGP